MMEHLENAVAYVAIVGIISGREIYDNRDVNVFTDAVRRNIIKKAWTGLRGPRGDCGV